MPYKAKRVCTHPGCNTLTNGGKCQEHKKAVHRVENHSKMYSRAWRKARIGFLRSHPICVECEKDNVMTVATEVDHIIPHKGDKEKFWQHDNWQSLCKSHHSRKTMLENQAEGKMK